MSLRARVAGPALLTVSALAALVASELALRVYCRNDGEFGRRLTGWDPLAVKVEPHGQSGYRQRPGAVFPYPNGTRATTNAQGFRGPMVVVPKPAGTFRVLLSGESTTHGWGVDDSETVDAYMRRLLAARWPARRFDVANLAFDGYDAYQVWQRLRSDGFRLSPDVVIVNLGINDVRNARYANLTDPDPRTLIWEADLLRLRSEQRGGGPTTWTLVKHYLYLARLPALLRAGLRASLSSSWRTATVHHDAADNFERNVRRIVADARRRGIPVLLSTPPSAFGLADAPRGMSPREYWIVDPATTQAYRDTLASRLRSVASALQGGSPTVTYVNHPPVPGSMFLDDCHLTSAGSRRLAEDFVAALAPLIPTPAVPGD